MPAVVDAVLVYSGHVKFWLALSGHGSSCWRRMQPLQTWCLSWIMLWFGMSCRLCVVDRCEWQGASYCITNLGKDRFRSAWWSQAWNSFRLLYAFVFFLPPPPLLLCLQGHHNHHSISLGRRQKCSLRLGTLNWLGISTILSPSLGMSRAKPWRLARPNHVSWSRSYQLIFTLDHSWPWTKERHKRDDCRSLSLWQGVSWI